MQLNAGSRLAVAVALGAALLVSGCDSIKDATGMTKEPPDEFRVVSNKPLSMPPEFELRPPKREGEGPDARQPRSDAEAAVFGGDDANGSELTYEGTKEMSRGERALLGAAGAEDASGGVRDSLEAEARKANEASLTDRLVFWRERNGNASVLDAQAESERLRGNAAVGKEPTEGESPTIEREGDEERGWLEGIF
ncbi:Beta-barrel assembly machine subunit BamF [Limimonas halophila]|uniref:Beta-barrel assembly machine subunit BamF n=1 Tax=Limimonas halophila TaxID=1082479 RepID=A0A1G7V8C3_9PROT|nr:DUF3035 domain-containing protein [Limimonas halophila]SDG55781.1 Beta-barrel assembly machine subunit BamF [Limimonas halophila]